MEQNKLLKSQVEKIEIQIRKLEEQIEELKCNNKGVSGSIYSSKDKASSDVIDPELARKIKNLEKELAELRQLIKEALVIENYNENCIEIGTRFEATINYGTEIETDEYILVQSREGYNVNEKDAIYAMISSPLGSAVLGKTVGSQFNYNAHGKIFKGVINKIIPNEKEEEKGIQKTK